MSGKVIKVSGPLVVAEGLEDAGVGDIVRVGKKRLTGEIVAMTGSGALIQMLDKADALTSGETADAGAGPLCAELGPGLLGSVFDALQRPMTETGVKSRIALNRDILWEFVPTAADGDTVNEGDVLGTVQETGGIIHKIMVPAGLSGTVVSIQEGSYTVADAVCLIKDGAGESHKLMLSQSWPVRKSRPCVKKLLPVYPLHSGIRVVDTFFPLAKGGTAAISGKTGSGKTALLQKLAGNADADILVYVCCGGRGNELGALRAELSEIKDADGMALINRTVIIADTDDMPAPAAEASICTGAAVAEYYRDMGYNVLLFADTLSSWAEAQREMSERLFDPPCEDGYPAYLTSKISEFFERAGLVSCLGSGGRKGSLTIIAAISTREDGGEPVLTAALRGARAHWRLDSVESDAHRYPAVDVSGSYSMYADSLRERFAAELGERFVQNAERALGMLREETEDRLTLAVADTLRESFLRQNAFDTADGSSSFARQAALLRLILDCADIIRAASEQGADTDKLTEISLSEKIEKLKYFTDDELGDACKRLLDNIRSKTDELLAGDKKI